MPDNHHGAIMNEHVAHEVPDALLRQVSETFCTQIQSSRAGWDWLASGSEGERHGRVAERPRCASAQRVRVRACPIGKKSHTTQRPQ
eukprot:2320150-Pleurochrysis_carterae.AAC.1